MDDAADDVLAALALRLGVLLRRRLGEAGISVDQVKRRLGKGQLVALTQAAYVSGDMTLLTEHAWLRALLEAGPDALLSGEVACALYGLKGARRAAPPLVVVPHHRLDGRRAGKGVVRTTRPPRRHLVEQEELDAAWPVAPLPRALADAISRADVEHARALVGDALSSGRVDVRQLVHELRATRTCTLPARAVLSDLDVGGVWSVPEGDVLDLVRTSSVLPVPEMNVLLVDAAGRPVLRPDLLWWVAAFAASVDSRENHGDVRQWAETLAKAAAAEARGLLVAHLAPSAFTAAPREHLLVLERHFVTRYGCGAPEELFRAPGVGPVPRR